MYVTLPIAVTGVFDAVHRKDPWPEDAVRIAGDRFLEDRLKGAFWPAERSCAQHVAQEVEFTDRADAPLAQFGSTRPNVDFIANRLGEAGSHNASDSVAERSADAEHVKNISSNRFASMAARSAAIVTSIKNCAL